MAIQRGLEKVSVTGPGYMLRVMQELLARNAKLWLRFRVSVA